ncbi:metal chaperone, involved in Zn homeostasis, GTPase of family protein [Izhakiella australiensis]|uniref:Metal chaperone, involved in Zn homeostasis, GTPase of family protein n=1 Tax=Izhakiella australiensis TaxID=1926881 RepID=A0A1S8YL07_9GAMM|nr:D-arabinono-1,4-lactone oxidase [Izhakiella australiensis]OON39801.1 metal chaperone, involved in Zn homeostasis, GTPase of family protein [Izhakiella australiensis]
MIANDSHFPPRQTHLSAEDRHIYNWAKNAALADTQAVIKPENEAQLQAAIAGAQGQVRVMGSRMSPGRMLSLQNSQDTLIDTSALRGLLSSDEHSATFAGGTSLHEVYQVLTAMNRMLAASPGVIDSQTLAGAISTGTHGQGLQQSSLADEALSIRLVDAEGDVHHFDRQHPWFGAVQLGLGALGAISAVTLRTRPATLFTCYKNAGEADNLEKELLEWNQQWPLSKCWWFPDENQVHVWNAHQASDAEQAAWRNNRGDLVVEQQTSDEMNDTVDKTLVQMRSDTNIRDENGKPFRTVTRFKDFSNVTGDIYQVFCRGIATPQINIEIGIPLARAPQVIEALKAWHASDHPHMHYPVILRCTGPSQAWLSPAWQEATCFFGFVVYYAEDGSLSQEGVAFLREVEKLLAQHGGKPHWGKYFDASLYDWPALYPQWQQFASVRAALDPQGKFLNQFSAELLA